ncbi:hypothetical protein CAPTEDRAFT_93140 [Capitella teleta]|uniref:G-protein coupled receptors family 1 profile domain-containing protein n=1 Tax=Capitella teleta TaxID=283909 RepID=X2BBV7_CAPTE|nr:hypothetical protein CAPTEDRAFT_93140 [Capitella teleta]|eukprot:ELU10169.1 hypothetical protein CAPTEDRAFT_93140 [Capitella teleta]
MKPAVSETPVKTEFILPLLILIVITCSVNIIVIICVRRHRPLQKNYNNMYVVSLAMADFVVGLFVMPGMLVYTIYGYWPFSQTWCTLWIVPDSSCCTVSMIHLCLIAYDRCLALTQPLEYRQPNRQKTIIFHICAAWVIAFLTWMPAVIYAHIHQKPAPNECFFMPGKNYIITLSILIYYVPIVAMVVLYVRCLYFLQKRYSKINADTATSSVQVISSLRVATNPIQPTKLRHRRQEHIRSVRTLGVIIVTFLFCWLPFSLIWPIQAHCGDCISVGWYKYAYWVSYLNSTINPLIYFIGNKDFREAIVKVTKC